MSDLSACLYSSIFQGLLQASVFSKAGMELSITSGPAKVGDSCQHVARIIG